MAAHCKGDHYQPPGLSPYPDPLGLLIPWGRGLERETGSFSC